MDGSLKNKNIKPKKRTVKTKSTGAEQKNSIKSCKPKENMLMNFHEENEDILNSPETEIPNCSQFIEHEPSVIWGSPQGSSDSNNEQNERIIDLITPPQPQKITKNKSVRLTKPIRKLKPDGVSPSFLTKLLAFSEQYKDSEESTSVAGKGETEINKSCDEVFERPTSNTDKQQEVLKKPQLVTSSTPVRDDYDMLFAADDDDVIVQCTQQIEEMINETEICHPKSKAISHQDIRKSKQLDINGSKTSNMSNMRTPKPSTKFSSPKSNNIHTDQSPLPKRKIRTPHSAKFFKSGVFVGYGTRKSPRIKKNILETLNSSSHQENYNDSLESALQTFLDDDYSFLENSVINECPEKVDDSIKRIDKRQHNVNTSTSGEKTIKCKMKTRQNEIESKSPQQPKSNKSEQSISKSKAGNSNKLQDEYRAASFDRRKTIFETISIEYETSNKPKPSVTKPNTGNSKKLYDDSSDKRKTVFETLTFEDDLVNETELVNVLDIVESQAVPSSPPLRCTPEEIQRKRIEAKQKLAKKKLSANKKSSVSTILKPKR